MPVLRELDPEEPWDVLVLPVEPPCPECPRNVPGALPGGLFVPLRVLRVLLFREGLLEPRGGVLRGSEELLSQTRGYLGQSDEVGPEPKVAYFAFLGCDELQDRVAGFSGQGPLAREGAVGLEQLEPVRDHLTDHVDVGEGVRRGSGPFGHARGRAV